MRYIYLFSVLVLAACSIAPTAIPSTHTPVSILTEMSSYRYLALGDSYTIGQSVPATARWPNQLQRLLSSEGVQIEVTVIARTGWTVDELWQGIQKNPPTGTYDLVTLLIGVNDQYRNYPIAGYRDDFKFMLGKAIEYAGDDPTKVIVLSIPDWGYTPFAATSPSTEPISQQIDEFNAINFEETENAGANYVDVTVISRMGMDDFELIAGDQLHPSGKMYAMWSEKVLPIALKILKK